MAILKGKFEFAKLSPGQALWFAKEALEALRPTKRIGGDRIFRSVLSFFKSIRNIPCSGGDISA